MIGSIAGIRWAILCPVTDWSADKLAHITTGPDTEAQAGGGTCSWFATVTAQVALLHIRDTAVSHNFLSKHPT